MSVVGPWKWGRNRTETPPIAHGNSRPARFQPARAWPAKRARGEGLEVWVRSRAANGRRHRPTRGCRTARGSALNAHRDQNRYRPIGDGYPVVLGMPLGPGPAHVMLLGSVRVEQAPGQILHEFGEIGRQARRLVNCLSHDPLRSTDVFAGSASLRRSCGERPMEAIVRANLLKTSTNLLVISVS